jgi:hypothetical protein
LERWGYQCQETTPGYIKVVCKPKKKRGLGIIKSRLQNDALLIKNLDKFFSRADLPWVKLIWSQYYANGPMPFNKMLFLVEKYFKVARYF